MSSAVSTMSTNAIQAELDGVAEQLRQAIPDAIAAVGEAAASGEHLYAVMLIVHSDLRSVSIAGNTVETVASMAEQFGDADRFAWQLSVPEWGISKPDAGLRAVSERLQALARSLDVGVYANEVAPIWKRMLVDVVTSIDLRSLVSSTHDGEPLVGVSAHEPEGMFPLILEVSEAVNTQAWHEQLVAYAAVYDGNGWPEGLDTIV